MAIIDWGRADSPHVTCLGMGDPTLFTDAQEFAEGLGDLMRVAQSRGRRRLRTHGLSASQSQGLRAILETGGLTVNQLAAYLGVDKSSASRAATTLEDAGHVARETNPKDGRVVTLVGTPAGEALFRTLQADEVRDYAELLQDIEPEARAEIARLVAELGRCLAAVADTTDVRLEPPAPPAR